MLYYLLLSPLFYSVFYDYPSSLPEGEKRVTLAVVMHAICYACMHQQCSSIACQWHNYSLQQHSFTG